MAKLEALGHAVCDPWCGSTPERAAVISFIASSSAPTAGRPAAAGGAPVPGTFLRHALVLCPMGHTGALRRHEPVETTQIGGFRDKESRRFLHDPVSPAERAIPVTPAILFCSPLGIHLTSRRPFPVRTPRWQGGPAAPPAPGRPGAPGPSPGCAGRLSGPAAGDGPPPSPPTHLGMVPAQAQAHLPQLPQNRFRLLVGVAGQPVAAATGRSRGEIGGFIARRVGRTGRSSDPRRLPCRCQAGPRGGG